MVSLSNAFDVVVVGGGPGGSSTAALLGKQGKKVLLVDKAQFPRDKTCGDAVSGKSGNVLRELGLVDIVEKSPHEEVWGITFSSPKGTIVSVDFPSQYGHPQGYICRRFIYDNLLFQNAKRFAEVWERFRVTDIIRENGFVVGVKGKHLDTGKEEEVRAKIVVGADGATSVVATKLGLNLLLPEHHCGALRAYYSGISGLTQHIEIHFLDGLIPGYFWIFPLSNGEANVGVGMVTSDIRKRNVNLKQAMMDVIEKNPVFKERFKNAKMIGDIKGWNLPFGSYRRKAHGNGFLLVGDAASLIDPFSGEGIGNAMTSGSYAAKTIEKAFEKNDFCEVVLKEYEDSLWECIGSDLKTSHRLQRLGKNRFLLNWVLGKAARNKELRETISGMIANRESKTSLISPVFYLKLLFM
ncbi:NAD(P)/FAD-dependent oxidoreductase [Candidatus Micrarchaeota archaeon]|nr:NAD(P)/FAD-dependent oxidoreductase [Candidatus Micrarchaeota archaeon]